MWLLCWAIQGKNGPPTPFQIQAERVRKLKPKSTAEHLRDGTYDISRHRNRVDHKYDGDPEMLDGLGEHGKDCYQRIIETTPPGVLAAADSLVLFAACRWWEQWRVMDAKASGPEGNAKDMHLAVCAFKHFKEIALQLGLTPVSRRKLQQNPTAAKAAATDSLTQMIKARKSAG